MPTSCAVRTRPHDDAAHDDAAHDDGACEVPVAVSAAVAPLLASPAAATVLARFPSAVYVRLPDRAVLALVTHDGVRLPNALVLAATSRQAPLDRPGPAPGARVAGGALHLDGVRYRPVRTWTPRTSTTGVLHPVAVAELAAGLAAAPQPHSGEVAARLRTGAARLRAALTTGDAGDAVEGLLGLGPGLTPAGDDLLAGVLVTSAHLGRGLPGLSAAVRRRSGVTTTLSADLLAHAGAGRAAPPVLDLLDALVGARPVAAALTALLAVGSTSGHDTATGVLLAARTLLEDA